MTPLKLINSLNKCDEYMIPIFTMGGCYRFHLFLKKIFPEAEPLINDRKNHIVTRIGKSTYDIKGKINLSDFVFHGYRKLRKSEFKMVKKWSFAHNNIVSTSCPHCSEDILIATDGKTYG